MIFDRYKCSVAEYARLTELQIRKLYLHPRNKKTGSLLLPGEDPRRRRMRQGQLPNTFETEVAALMAFVGAVGGMLPWPNVENTIRGLGVKHGKSPLEVDTVINQILAARERGEEPPILQVLQPVPAAVEQPADDREKADLSKLPRFGGG